MVQNFKLHFVEPSPESIFTVLLELHRKLFADTTAFPEVGIENIRRFSASQEIEYLVENYGMKEIHFLDDNASVNRNRFVEICQGIIDRRLDITWACPTGLAIWTLDEEVLRLMKKSGCYKVCFGIESGHPENAFGEVDLALGMEIPRSVMAFPTLARAHKHPVSPGAE